MTPMLLDIGGGEILILIVLAVVLLGPERVPDLARKAARVIKFVRGVANSATDHIKTELGPEYSDFALADLTPKNLVKYVLPPEVQAEMDALRADLAGVRSQMDTLQRQTKTSVDETTAAVKADVEEAVAKPDADAPATADAAAHPDAAALEPSDGAQTPADADQPADEAPDPDAAVASADDQVVEVEQAEPETASEPKPDSEPSSYDLAYAAAMARGSD